MIGVGMAVVEWTLWPNQTKHEIVVEEWIVGWNMEALEQWAWATFP